MVYINETLDMGRGVFAAQSFMPGQILFSAELIILSEIDTLMAQATDLRKYLFTYNEQQDCLVLGNGSLFNHDEAPNVGYRLGTEGSRTVMYFYALEPILANKQLFINYADDLRYGEKLVQYDKM